MSDNVHNPAHYTAGGIETIDFIQAKLGPDGFRAYCLGNVLKYVTRHALKNGDEDLKKAGVYLGWAIDALPSSVKTELPRTVSVPVYAENAEAIIRERDAFILSQAHGLGPGPAVDDEEPPLRAGTASKPDDLL